MNTKISIKIIISTSIILKEGLKNQRHKQLYDMVAYIFKERKVSFLQQTSHGRSKENTT